MKDKAISVIINSCDKYEDAWIPFFTLFKKYWPNCPYSIFLNTETKSFSFDGLNIICLNTGSEQLTWSNRLIKSLKKIHTTYVIMMLEDFFLLDYVKQDEIEKALEWIEQARDISCFQFYPNPQLTSVDDHCFPGYAKRDLKGKWWLRCQAALWKRKDLLKYLNPNESAWQFEEYGTNVAKLYNKRFYNCIDKAIMPFVYDVDRTTGYGLYEGTWLKSNFDLFEKEGIPVDFSKMGLWENGVRKPFVCPVSKKTMRERWMYLLFGGSPEPYMSIANQIKFAFLHPKGGIKMLYRKMVYCFTPYKLKTR